MAADRVPASRGLAGNHHGGDTTTRADDRALVLAGYDAFGASAELSAGTLRVAPQAALGGDGSVAVLVHMTARRPDGRVLDDHQVHVFGLEDGRTATVDQYVGDPAAVEAFWA